jgi:hypothetical protein
LTTVVAQLSRRDVVRAQWQLIRRARIFKIIFAGIFVGCLWATWRHHGPIADREVMVGWGNVQALIRTAAARGRQRLDCGMSRRRASDLSFRKAPQPLVAEWEMLRAG